MAAACWWKVQQKVWITHQRLVPVQPGQRLGPSLPVGAVIDPVQLVQPALAQGPVPGVVSWPCFPTRPKVVPVPKVTRMYRLAWSHWGIRELFLHTALSGQSSFTTHSQGPSFYWSLTMDDMHGPPHGASISIVPSMAPAERAFFLAPTVQATVWTLGVLAVGSSQVAVIWVVEVAAVSEARGGALALQVARVLARCEVIVHMSVLGVHFPLSVWRSRPTAIFKTQTLAHAVHAVQLFLSHLRNAVEALAAERLLLHYLPLEVPANPFLG